LSSLDATCVEYDPDNRDQRTAEKAFGHGPHHRRRAPRDYDPVVAKLLPSYPEIKVEIIVSNGLTNIVAEAQKVDRDATLSGGHHHAGARRQNGICDWCGEWHRRRAQPGHERDASQYRDGRADRSDREAM